MSTDATLDAAIAYVRPSIFRKAWDWYLRVTGYTKAKQDRLNVLTSFPAESRCTCLLCNPKRLP